MDVESLLPFLSAGVLVAIVVAWILSSRRRSQQLQQLGELAEQKGWTLTTGSESAPVSLSGAQDGIAWTMTQHRRSSATYNSDTYTDAVNQWFIEWCSSASLPEGNVLLWPGGSLLGDPSRLSGTVGRLASKILAMAVDLPLHNATPVLAGSDELRKKYTVFASSVEAARFVLIGVEKMLVEWPVHPAGFNMPSVSVDASGVTIRLERSGASLGLTEKIGSELLLERIVRLGVAAARSLRDYAQLHRLEGP